MLGLGSSVNSEEGYGKAERYRERFHIGGVYHHGNNPIGRDGKESDYIGDFTEGTDDDNYGSTNASTSISSGVMRIRTSATNGAVYISVSTIPNTNYIFSYLNDPNDDSNDAHTFAIGSTAGGFDVGGRLIVPLIADNTTKSISFNSGNNKNVYASWTVPTKNYAIFIDNISFKEA